MTGIPQMSLNAVVLAIGQIPYLVGSCKQCPRISLHIPQVFALGFNIFRV